MAAIDLTPAEWALATWRPDAPPPEGLPRPFDPDVLRQEIKQAKNDYGYWRWRGNPMPLVMSADEGAFWLRAGSRAVQAEPAAAADRALAESGTALAPDTAFALALNTQLPSEAVMSALVAVVEPAWVAERLAEGSWLTYEARDLAESVREHLVPRLSPADRDRLAEAAAGFARAALQDPEYVVGASANFAAQMGCHAEVAEIVARWPDKWFADYGGGGYTTIAFGLGSRELFLSETRRTAMRPVDAGGVVGWLAHTELEDLGVLEDAVLKAEGRESAEAVLAPLARRLHAPEAAPMMLRLVRSRAPKLAFDWLREHPAGLAALPGREALEMRRRLGLEPYPYADRPLRAPRITAPPRAPAADGLPPLVVGGERLADAEVQAVLAALAADKPLPVKLDTEAAEAFAWELFQRWLLDGAPVKERWRMTALGRLGGDDTALRLAPLIRVWPGESQHKRAVLGLEVLRAIGTDTALMQLNGIAQKLKFKALQQRAREAIEEIATELGLTRDELEDRIVPDCGLDADGRHVIDYGPRQFEFVLGADMKPMVRDEAGKLRASPPKPGVRDVEGATAQAEWKLLRKQVGEVAKVQAARLERALVTRRRWPVADFETHVVRHPLMRLLARRLVWGSGALAFRVTEEGDYADVRDEPVTVSEPVRLVHPLELTEDERAAWGDLLADYEIVAPFPQLGRTLFDVSAGIERFQGIVVDPLRLIGTLARAGWERGPVEDGGIYHSHRFEFDGGAVEIQYADGILIGYPSEFGDQTVERVVLDGRSWTSVDPVVRNEIVATLEELAQRA